MGIKQQIWDYFLAKDFSAYGIAGIMGNMWKESNFITNNVEDRAPYTDEQYTTMVDNGTYTNFVYDNYGYGLIQWTYSTLKQELLNTCKSRNKSISDLSCQLDTLYSQLQREGLLNQIKNSTSVWDSTTTFMLKFERPYDQSKSAQEERVKLSESIFNELNNRKGGTRMKYSSNNRPLVCLQTNSTCYNGTSKMSVKGVLWHSTGANNPTIKRYVQPSENDSNYAKLLALIGKNTGGNDWNHISIQAGLNAWIGQLADGSVTSVQTMPWDYKPWGCGSGGRGSCNNGWIQFEICEDNLNDKNYFDKIYQEACQLTAYLCNLYKLNPKGSVNVNGVSIPVILCHQDSYQLGFGSNHADIYHWFTRYGKNMNTVREDVANLMEGASPIPVDEIPVVQVPNTGNGYIMRGEESARVRKLQEDLIRLGYSCGSSGADGDFGKATEQAVLKFQRDYHLEVDGVVGQQTLQAIEAALNKMYAPTDGIYRIRKTWADARSQQGAYKNLESAKKVCMNLGAEYKVFDSNGNIVFSVNNENQQTQPVTNTQPVAPATKYATVMIGSSSKDERGQYRGGTAGDQSGKEVYILNWYYQNWNVVLRPTSDALAEKIAVACEAGCNNNNIGYDQLERNSIYTQAKQVGLDLSKINVPCECDCSSFVSVCCICAGLPEGYFYAGGNLRVTSNLKEACLATKQFSVLTDAKYLTQKNYLKRGDILLNESQHVVIVLADGPNVERAPITSTAINTDTFTPNTVLNESYKVRITTKRLNVRSHPDVESAVVTTVTKDQVFTIVDERGGWGKLKSGAGWIDLQYTTKL